MGAVWDGGTHNSPCVVLASPPALPASLPQLCSTEPFASCKATAPARPRLLPLSPPGEPADQLTQLTPCGIQFPRIPAGAGKTPWRRGAKKVGHSCCYPAQTPERGQDMLWLEDSPERRDEKHRGSTSCSGSALIPHVLTSWMELTHQSPQGGTSHMAPTHGERTGCISG